MMRPFWVSWYGDNGGFEYHGPWWISGFEAGGDERDMFCAAVMASSEQAAKQAILDTHDAGRAAGIDWSFVSEKPSDWQPFSGRFPRAGWMRWPWPNQDETKGSPDAQIVQQ